VIPETTTTLRKTLGACCLPALLVLLGAMPCTAQGAGEDLQERVAALKQSLAQSQKALRTYQWVETTTVSMKGEVKSQKQMSCYYGADGALQKLPISATPPPKKKGGLRGKIAESKKEELTQAMQQAVALVKSYVPPDSALIQKAVDAGKASIEILQPGKIVRLVFRDYRLPGDSLGITMDLTTNRLAGIAVATYLGQPSSPVDMNVSMGVLNDGTSYAATTQLALKSEQLTVTVANTGYKRMN
jgi:hypothetical protein